MSQENKILCTWLKNSLNPKDSVSIFSKYTGEVASRYIRSFIKSNISDERIAVALNGKQIFLQFEDPILNSGDHICFCICENDQALRIVGAVALTVAAFYAQQHWTYGQIWGAAFIAGAGYLIAGAVPLLIPDSITGGSTYAGSQNYGFAAGSNSSNEGAVVPALIGERWFSPIRISAHRHLPAEESITQHLRMQFLLCGGRPIEPITSDDILINDKTIDDYKNAIWEYSPGRPDEDEVSTLVPSTYTEQDISTELPQNSVEWENEDLDLDVPMYPSKTATQTITENVNNITFSIFTPTAFMYLGSYIGAGGYSYDCYIKDKSLVFHLEYAVAGSGSWTEIQYTASELMATHPKGWGLVSSWYLRNQVTLNCSLYDLASNNYDLRFWITSDNATYDDIQVSEIHGYGSLTGETYTTNGIDITRVGLSFIFSEGLYYFTDSGAVTKHSVSLIIKMRPYGESEWTHVRYYKIEEATTEPFRRFMEFVGLDPDQWEIQPMISGILPTDVRYKDTVVFEFIQEGIDIAFSYPDSAILSIDIPALESFNQSWPTVQVKAKTTDFTDTRVSTNPAWASYYRMTEVYGIDEDDINLTKWETWASFCDTNSLTVGLYFDTELTMKESLDQISQAGRATIIPKGSTWDVIIDTIASPRHTFGDDNIIAGSFKQKWFSKYDRANTIIAYFFDEDDYNLKKPIKIVHPNVDEGLEESIEREIILWGVNNKDQAVQIAISILNQTQLVRREISWQSFIDAIDCHVGDVCYFQHKGPIWGFAAGRVKSSTSTTVTCDIPLDFDDSANSSRDFRILIRHQIPKTGETDDFIEVLEINNPYPNTGVVTYTLTSGTWEENPEAGSIVLIGWLVGTEESTSNEKLSTKKIIVTNIERNKNRKFDITATDYYDDMYITDYVVISDYTPEGGLTPSNIYAGTSWSVDGSVQKNYVELLWTGGNSAIAYYIFYRVDYDDDDVFSDWFYYKEVYGNSIKITDLTPGYTYQFSVNTIKQADESNYVEIDYQVVDLGDQLTNTTNLRCADTGTTTWVALDLDLIWDEVTIFTVDHYRVEIIGAGQSVIRQEKVIQERFVYTYDMNVQDNGGYANPTVYVRIVAVDSKLNESATSITAFSNQIPSAPTILETVDKSTDTFEGRNLDVVWTPPSDEDLTLYEVTITHGGLVLRTEYTTSPHYIYTYEMNQEDSGLTVTTTSTTTTTTTTSSTTSSTSSTTSSTTTTTETYTGSTTTETGSTTSSSTSTTTNTESTTSTSTSTSTSTTTTSSTTTTTLPMGDPEDFSTYSEETDPNSHFTIDSSTQLTFSLSRNETAYLADDKGIDHFSSNFEHKGSFKITDDIDSAAVVIWMLANTTSDPYTIEGASGSCLYGYAFDGGVDDHLLRLREIDAGTRYTSGDIVITQNTQYWFKVTYDSGVGTYGTLYLDLYDDSDYSSQVGSQQSLTLHASPSFRYNYALSSYNFSSSEVRTGNVYALYLQE